MADADGPEATFTPGVDGTYTVEVTVTDPEGLTDTATAEIGTNGAPEFVEPTPEKPVVTLAGTELTFEVAADDPDGDTVEITTTDKPEGASFDEGTFRWTPEEGRSREATVSFEATDGQLTATRTVEVRVRTRDRGEMAKTSSGCGGCSAGRTSSPPASMLGLLLGLLGLGALRRRR